MASSAVMLPESEAVATKVIFDPDVVTVTEAGPDFPYFWYMNKALTYTPSGEPTMDVNKLPFRTDFASIPWVCTWLIPRYGLYTKAAIVHDYLCRTQHDKFSSDRTFRLAMKDLKVPWVTRTLMWAAPLCQHEVRHFFPSN